MPQFGSPLGSDQSKMLTNVVAINW